MDPEGFVVREIPPFLNSGPLGMHFSSVSMLWCFNFPQKPATNAPMTLISYSRLSSKTKDIPIKETGVWHQNPL